ncbi:MAG TPA: tetratricopeptide repeat protein [Rhizomicrobium sp.]|nr:tetratricopeptide repeat protein [Rhizomicrobium sp.]
MRVAVGLLLLAAVVGFGGAARAETVTPEAVRQTLQAQHDLCGADESSPATAAQKIDACTRLIESGHETPENLAYDLYSRGQLYANTDGTGNNEKAVADLTRAIPLMRTPHRAYFLRAIAYSQMGKLKEAEADYLWVLNDDATDTDALYNLSGVHRRLRDYDASGREIDAYIKAHPEDGDGYLQRAVTAIAQNKNAQALPDLDKSEKIKDQDAVHYQRARAYLGLKKFDLALAEINRFFAHVTDDADAYAYRGQIYEGLRQNDAALADYTKAIELDAEGSGALYYRGSLYLDLDKYDLSIADMTRYIAAAPDDPDGYHQRGRDEMALQKYSMALADFDKVLSLNPKYDAAHYNKGLVHLDQHNYAAAEDDFAKAIALDPSSGDAFRNRGRALFNLGQYDKAVEAFTQGLARDADKVDSYYMRGATYRQMQKYDLATADQARAAALKPDADTLTEIYIESGLSRREAGDIAGAIADYSKGLAAKPNATLYYDRGIAFTAVGDLVKAEADYTSALALVPTSVKVLANRGFVRNWRGNYQGAVEDFGKALHFDEKPATAVPRGYAYLALGQFDAAIDDFKLAARLGPTLMGPVAGMCEAKIAKGVALDEAAAPCEAAFGAPVLDSNEAYAAMAVIALRRQNFAAAIDRANGIFARTAKNKPNDYSQRSIIDVPDAYYLRGIAKMRMGQDGSADIAAAKALEAGIAERYAKLGVTP